MNGSNPIAQAAGALGRARSVVAITGAGISAESGVPTFRGPGGLWRNFRPEDLATPEAFARDPRLVWEWYLWRRSRIAATKPNAGHFVLARFERRFPSFTLLTQNVDGLHRHAGSQHVVELHGNIWRARCSEEPSRVFDHAGTVRSPESEVRSGTEPASTADAGHRTPDFVCPNCGALLRPDVVWFGEPLDEDAIAQASDAVRACDVLLVVGTSAIVYPVAALPSLARRGQAVVVEVNVDDTPLTPQADIVIRGPSGLVLPDVERLL